MTEIDYYQGQIDRGFTTVYFDILVKLHQEGAKYLKNTLKAKTVFEFGSGLGFFVLGAQNIGLDATGYGIDSRERDFALSKGVHPERYVLGQKNKLSLAKKYDAAYCVEVAEHIPDVELIPIFKELAANCQYLYFTSTPHPTTPAEDAAWGHINLKDAAGWIDLMAKVGFEYVEDRKEVTAWGMLFKSIL